MNNINSNNKNNFNISLLNPFLLTSMSLRHQQYATEWIKIYKEFTAYSQKVSELWLNPLWNSWIIKEDNQMRENLRLQNHTDDHNV